MDIDAESYAKTAIKYSMGCTYALGITIGLAVAISAYELQYLDVSTAMMSLATTVALATTVYLYWRVKQMPDLDIEFSFSHD